MKDKSEYQEKKRQLGKAYRIDEMIKSNKEELERLKECVTGISSIECEKERVQTSKVKSDAAFVGNILAAEKMEEEIKREIQELCETRLDLRTAINKVENTEEKLVLRERYLNQKTWKEICKFMNMSLRTVYRIHERAVKKLDLTKVGIT